MNKPYIVKRLETMLRIWEQTMFVANAETRTSSEHCTGAIKNWRSFRNAVLDRNKRITVEEFGVPDKIFYNYFVEVITYQFFPHVFANWSRSSRRVYSLSQDMQIDLELTSVAGITWQDVNPPFPCFVINLPIPVPGLFNNLIDTLVVEFKKGWLHVIALGDELDSFKPLPDELRKKIASAARNQNFAKLQGLCAQARTQQHFYIPANQYGEIRHGNLSEEIIPDRLEVEDLTFDSIRPPDEKEKKRSLRFWIPIYRIIIGLCMHLEDLQQSNVETSPQGDQKQNSPVTTDPKAVTSTENLLTVNYGGQLTAEERRIHGIIRRVGSIEALRELGSHFRSAHRRRPPGQGDNPTARKSVKVKWTIVNEARLPVDALPSGSVVEVK